MIKRKNIYKHTTLLIYLKAIAIIVLRKLIKFKVKFFFSQAGEDITLSILLDEIPDEDIYYVDVGCNDPIRDSNTFLFYLNGGSGICIDGNRELIKKYKKIRPNDIALCNLVSDKAEEVTFYVCYKNQVSTVSKEMMENRSHRWPVKEKLKMTTSTLNDILRENLPNGQKIHLLSIDVEGYDFKVLKSIDLNQYQPMVIIIELLQSKLSTDFLEKNEIVSYLSSYGYELRNFASWNAYFVLSKEP